MTSSLKPSLTPVDEEMEELITSAELLKSEKIEENGTEMKNPIIPEHHQSVSVLCSDYLRTSSLRKKKKKKKKAKKKAKKNKINDFYDIAPIYPQHEAILKVTEHLFAADYSKQQHCNIPTTLKFDLSRESAFFFGRTPTSEGVGKHMGNDGHIAVFGGSGCGKTTGIAIPTLYTWKGTIFSFDFKGDLIKHVERRRKPIILYLLRNHQNAFYYDPFYILRKEGQENLVENARDLAQAIIPLPHDIAEPFWIESARNILTGAILYYYRLGDEFNDAMIEVKTTPMKKLVPIISRDKMAKACINPDVVLDPKMLAGISMTLHNHIEVFATDTLIQDAFSPSGNNQKECIKWEDLENRDIFIRMDQSRCEQWKSVMRLMVVQLIRTLERRPEKYEPAGKGIAPTLLMLDEFPQYGKIDIFTSALRILRSKNVTVSIFCQSLADLDEIYGEVTRRALLDNCPYKAILNSSDAETQRYFSDLVGTVKIPSKGITANFDEFGQPAGYSVNINEAREPVIHPHEFASLTDIVLLHPGSGGFCLVEKEINFRNNTYPKLIAERRINNYGN